MGILNFMRTPKHQRFDYKPRHFDADKDELEERLAKYKKGNDKTSSAKKGISRGFARKSGGGYRGGKEYGRSNKRLVVILLILIALSYYFLVSYLPKIIDILE